MHDATSDIRRLISLLIPLIFAPLLAQAQVAGQAPVACGDGGTLMRLSGENNFNKNLLNIKSFAKTHAELTAKQPAWLKDLTQPSEANRVYQKAGNKPVRIYWLCDAANCSINFAYGAIEGNLEKYGVLVSDNADFHIVGDLSPNAQRAIACAARCAFFAWES